MEAVKLPGMNRELAPPKGWDPEKNGECTPLPVFAEVHNGSIVMTSAWKPSEEELAHLTSGGAVALVIYGTLHPPIAVGVFAPEHVPDARVPVLDAATINALPENVRSYIHWLTANGDPAWTLRDNFRLTEENKALRVLVEKQEGCAEYLAYLESAVQAAGYEVKHDGGRLGEANFRIEPRAGHGEDPAG